jgi:hypothetical protein
MNSMALRSTLCLLAFLLVAVLVADAAPGVGAEFSVASDMSQQMRIPAVTYHSGVGRFLAVWSERANEEIRGQLVGLDGTAVGSDFRIASGGGERDFPAVASVTNRLHAAQEMSLVSWDDTRGGSYRIYGQLIGSDGNSLVGTSRQLSTADGQFPAIAYGETDTAEGVFLVVWQGSAGGHAKVLGQIVQGATDTVGVIPGSPVGPNFQIADSTLGDTLDPRVAFDPLTRRFLVVWADTRGAAGLQYDIWGQLVDPNGGLIGANFRISAQSGFERAPSVAYHPLTREFLVVWNSGQPMQDVFAQRVSATAGLLGGVIDVAVTTAGESAAGVVVNPDSGHYVIPLAVDNGVEAQLLGPSGAVLGTPVQVSADTSSSKGRAVAAQGGTIVCPSGGAAGTSEVFVVWPDDRAGSSTKWWQDLYGRMVELQTDTDCDGLLDDWETSGIDSNGDGTIDLDLPALGANPNHKDLFVEVDFFDCAVAGGDCAVGDVHTHQPQANAINSVVAAFAAAPLANPDGSRGIALHVLVDEALAHRTTCSLDASCFDPTKAAHFGTIADRASPNSANILTAKRLAVRYNLWAHNILPGMSYSGISELPGNDFIVSLGMWPACAPGFTDACDRNWNGTPACAAGANCQSGGTIDEQAGTFMHELGHTLGLRHGGADHENCKPNYLSIMTYVWQTIGLQPGDIFDYSRDPLPALGEGSLNEALGIQDGAARTTFFGPPSNLDGVDQPVGAPDGFLNDDWSIGAGQGAIDWNQSCQPVATPGCDTQNPVAADINNMGIGNCRASSVSPLTGYDDWDHLELNFRYTGDWVDGVHRSAADQQDMTVQDAQAVATQRPATQLAPSFQQPPTNTKGYAVPSNLDWRTLTTAAQPVYFETEIDFDSLELSPQLAGLSLPAKLPGGFQWEVQTCMQRRPVPVVFVAGVQATVLAPAGAGPLARCSSAPGFTGNALALAPGTIRIDLTPLRQSGVRVVAASAVVRSCGGTARFQAGEAGAAVAKSVAITPSDASSVVLLQGSDLANIGIDGQELVVDRIRLTLRCPGRLECASMVADDFLADGKPVKSVTFWGSYLDDRFIPAAYGGVDGDAKDVDGWLLGFFSDQPQIGAGSASYSRPNSRLGLYYCPAAAVAIRQTRLTGCDPERRPIFSYSAPLSSCLPIEVAAADPRDQGSLGAMPPALGNAFAPVAGRIYWLAIQAVTGVAFDSVTLAPQSTINNADGDFWGWLGTPSDQRIDRAVSGCAAADFSTPRPPGWLQADWAPVAGGPCATTDQAFDLIAAEVVARGK